MEGLGLFPHNCGRCGFWTATELQRKSKGWTLLCTHCGTVQRVQGDTRRFRLFVASVERFVTHASTQCPELARLTVRGAYAVYRPTVQAQAAASPPPTVDVHSMPE
jgi:uncharacterized Zn finger protein